MRERLTDGRMADLAPAAVVAVLVLAFVAISYWWVSEDGRLPNGDNGKHLLIAFDYHDIILDGYPWSPFAQYRLYPPLVHLVGAIGSIFAGATELTAITSENVVFVPLLAVGCYGAGFVAFGRWAGALTAVFAFASPMIGSLFHVFMLDGPTTALVAVTVWALLASDRFSRVGIAALAGVVAGAGMYAKSTFPLFILGLLGVMMLRGGWRHWRGWATFGGVWFAISAPWYLYHWTDLAGQTKGAAVGVQPYWYANVPYPARFSLDNFTWYGWNLVNNQLYLPLALFLAIGVGYFVWRWLARRDPGYTPELLGGALVGYLAISFITLDDPRYTLPGLIYAALIGTGWIAYTQKPLRVVAALLLATILMFNTSALNRGFPAIGQQKIVLPGAVPNPIGQNQLVIASTTGYIEGQPSPGPFTVRDLLKRAHDEGARQVSFEAASLDTGGYNLNGLQVFARSVGLRGMGADRAYITNKSQIYIFRTTPSKRFDKPCLASPIIRDGTALFIQWGPAKPKLDLHCPR